MRTGLVGVWAPGAVGPTREVVAIQAARTAIATPKRLIGSGCGADVLADEADDVLRGRPRREDLLHAHGLQCGDVLGRDDAAPEDRHVVGALLAQQLQHALEEIVVGAGQHAEPDGVRVFLHRGGHHLLGRLVQAGVDNLEAGVAQRSGHDLGAPVVTVEARLGDDNTDGTRGVHAWASSASRSRSPMAWIWARSPGTSFQSKPLPSLFQRGIRCRW